MSTATSTSTTAAAEAPGVGGARRTRRPSSVNRPLIVVLALAVALRVATSILYFPMVMSAYDSPRFGRAGPTGLFDDFWMPAGYPAFLKVVHHVSDALWFSIALQHLIGVGTAVAVYATLRRLGARTWLALVPTAGVAFNGDLLFLEHIMLADQFLFCFSVLACTATIYGLMPRVNRRWLVAAGALAMCAMLSRSVGLAVVAALTAVVLLLAPVAVRERLTAAGSLVAGALAVLAVYVGAFAAVGGTYLGLSDMRGWNVYSRVASFADCSTFTPPRGTRRLCERTPPEQRPGPFGYVWDANSISRRTFAPLGPQTADPLESFALEVIEHQPRDYALAVITDLARYVEPSIGVQKGYNGQPRELVSFGYRDAQVEQQVSTALDSRYDGTRLDAPGDRVLATYQSVARLDRLALLAAVVLTALGIFGTRGAARIGVATFGLAAFGLYLLPTVTVSYDFRYGIPPAGLLTVSAVVAAWGLSTHFGARRTTGDGPETGRLGDESVRGRHGGAVTPANSSG